MEKRFGIKDFFLFGLIACLIVVVVAAMWMFDRQYREILTIKRQNSELTRDVVQIKRLLAGGGEEGESFRLLREAEEMEGFARGDWMVDNFGTKVGKLTPLISTDVYASWVENLVMEGMAVRDPYTLEFVPRLAERWEISPDGLTMRFALRKGLEFSDGEPLDADDVLFTFAWMRNEAVDAPRVRAYMTKLKDVVKVDSHTVEFTFTEPYYLNFETVAGASILPEHFYSRYTPDEFNEKTGLLLGSGPYKLENPETWTPGELVELVRNDRYWGAAPTFDRIVFNEIESEATEMVVYGNEELDLIRCTPEQYEKLLGDDRVMGFSEPFKYKTVYGGYIYCGWNQLRKRDGKDEPTVFADKRVRRAMTMLLDRQRMADELFLGYATVASGPFAPGGPQAAPDVEPLPFDQEAAKRLLAGAGFADRDGDGVLDGPDGRPFRFTLTYPGGSDLWEKAVLFMKDNYARAGIVLVPERMDWPVLIQKLNQGDFDAITLGWSSSVESDPYQVFHSDAIKDQGDNRTSYRNPELDALIDRARVTVDRDERMKLWQEVHRILHEDQPYTFLHNRPALRLMNDRIGNVRVSNIGLNFELLNGGVIPWFVPEGQQRYTP